MKEKQPFAFQLGDLVWFMTIDGVHQSIIKKIIYRAEINSDNDLTINLRFGIWRGLGSFCYKTIDQIYRTKEDLIKSIEEIEKTE